MISFKQFILNEEKNVYVPTEITQDDFVEWCRKNATSYLKSGNSLFRGDSKYSSNFGHLDTKDFKRVSPNTENYYTIFMDNDQTWSAFPKRSKSLICSNSRSVASGFGTVRLTIPSDRSKIGVCNNSDLWHSFPYPRDLENADDMMTFSRRMFKFYQLPRSNYITYDELIENLKFITIDKIERDLDAIDDDFGTYNSSSKQLKYMIEHNVPDMLHLYRLFFDPSDFRTYTVGSMPNIKEGSGVECWLEGECVLVDISGYSPESESERSIQDLLRNNGLI